MAELLESICEQLSIVAQTHSSDEEDVPHLSSLIENIKSWNANTKHAILAAHAADGVLISSEKNIALAAQTKLDLISAGDGAFSSGRNILIRALKGVSIFAHAVGMKLVAASGNILIQSHNGDINLTATGRICISAGKKIELHAPEINLVSNGAQVNYGGGAIFQQSKGAHTIKSSTFSHSKGGDGSVGDPKFPSTVIETDERIILYHSQTGEPVSGRRYKLTLPDGRIIEGRTDEQGRTDLATAAVV